MPLRGPASATNDCGSGSLTTSQATQVATLTTSPPKGVLFSFWFATGKVTVRTVSNVTDSAGNTYTWAAIGNAVGRPGVCVAWAWIDTPPTTVTVTLSGAERISWSASYFAGSNGAVPPRTHDVTGGTLTASAVTTLTTTITPTKLHNLILAIAASAGTASQIAPVAGFTECDEVLDATAGLRMSCQWRISEGTGAVTYGSSTGTSGTWAIAAASFALDRDTEGGLIVARHPALVVPALMAARR